MKWRRRAAEAPTPEADVVEPAETGWATTSTGAMANWTALIRWGAWALLLGGPLLGGWAVASAGATTVTPAPVQPSRAVSEDAVGPAGFAEQVVAAYVRAGQGSSGKELAAFYPPAADLTWPQEAGSQRVESTSPVRVRKVQRGYWSVTVAARMIDEGGAKKKAPAGGLRFFQVPVRAEGARWVAATLPAEVAAPTGARVPELGYGTESAAVPSDPAVQTLQAFFDAYLTGRGELDRYLSPGTALRPVSPAPYASVGLTAVAEHDGGPAEAGRRPGEGERRRLLVEVEAGDRHGAARPMTYAIQLRGRGGRWEVAALEGAPALKTSSSAAQKEGAGR